MLSQLAENFVKNLFDQKNIKVLTQNFRHVGFEIDLIVQDKDQNLIAVEVKYRSDITKNLDQLISRKKMLALQRGLDFYEQRHFTHVQNKRIDLAIVSQKARGFYLFKYIVGN